MSNAMAVRARGPIGAYGLRNADLRDLAGLLEHEQGQKIDIVAPASAIHAEGGALVVRGAEPVLSADGVTSTTGVYQPTELADQGIAEKLGIPGAYLRKVRAEAPELYDVNVNGWLSRADKSYLLRGMRGQNGAGVARAFLSNGYRIIDNFDVLVAALDGIQDAGGPVQVDSCDLSNRRMYVRVRSDAARVYAPALLANYRSPFSGRYGADNPTVWAGFVITNSETGCGAYTITPRLIAQVCDNGMTITEDAQRAIHAGARLDDGVVSWSEATQRKTLELVTSQTRDAVRTFLSPAYVQRQVAAMEQAACVPVRDVEATVTTVSRALRYTETQRTAILAHFVQGADLSAGGIMHAVTSAAQTIADPDEAHELESSAVRAMTLAARS